jgi:hypothetical protein
MDLPRLARPLDGAPFAAPAILDRVAERWWRFPPRVRALWFIAAVALTLAAGTLHLTTSPWGAPTTVLVAAHDLSVGQPVGPDDVRLADWPASLVPAGAVLEPAGTVLAPVPAGSILTDLHLGDGGIGAALPEGRAAVGLPAELVTDLPPGSTIDLVAPDLDARGVVLASGAVVLVDDGAQVWVMVDRPAAADVAAAAANGTITVVVVPP